MELKVKNEKLYNLLLVASKFLEGKIYPLTIALAVLIGHVTALEFYFNFYVIISTTLALIICPTTKPFLIALTTFLYQIPLKHTPADFSYPIIPDRDYYSKPAIIATIIILGIIVFSAIIYRFVRYSYPKINKSSPLFYPITLFCLAMVANGVFSEEHSIPSLLYGIVQVVIFFFLFYLIFYGICDIEKGELVSYLYYVALLNALVLVGEIVFVYLTYEKLFVEGEIIREAINLGWGVANPVGFALTALIPMLTLGAMTDKHYILYTVATGITWVAAVATLSRNAMLFSTVTVIVCIVFACLRGDEKRKRFFRIISAAAAALVLIFFIVFGDELAKVLARLIKKGFSDNGRFELWSRALEDFASSPLFGIGFFAFGDIGTSTYVEVLPTLAHNTIMVLLSATGLFGLITYLYYRYKTVEPLIRRPSLENVAILITIGAIAAMGMLDNFIFYIYTMFYYTAVLAVSQAIARK